MHLIILSLLALNFVTFNLTMNYVRLDKIPGTIAGRLTKFYCIWFCIDDCGPLRYCQLFQHYDPVVRTGPNPVCLFKSELIPVLYDFRYKFKESNFYGVFRLIYKGMPMDRIFTLKDTI
ncbi:hypothetical protein CC78DRAFT_580854 [Lojkania enalia]|uniref:Uncharacterized protein n=1 Tax=Lojkania enalia TaxID=147567 RepID=A0A9P4K7N2_9PLEO|nr:hypothetical protein CC78DRAFT_580854 [Didymosphaeria enalia]